MNDPQGNPVLPEGPADVAPDPRPSSAESRANPLVARLAEEMARGWREGEGPRAEEVLAHHPELWDNPDDAIDLIYEEFCLRQECGRAGPPSEFLERFPRQREQLEVLLACHEALGAPAAAARFPEAGESLGDFRLLAELGRGAQGRVFLATQPALADRPVVLKLTPRTGGEHLSLARLQHTCIVPLYSAQDDPASNLRVLCMPYFGGASLAHLLDAAQHVPLAERRGQHLLDALDEVGKSAPVKLPGRGPGRLQLGRGSFEEALCWVGALLAEGLQYAHERGLVHLDLKPSNVLLADDGTPMLLDFHLAQPPIVPGGPPPDWIGGTVLFMSREQHAALAAVREGRPITLPVDGRADIFSLGALLYGALGGQLPVLPGASPPLCRCNPHVSVGLSDILQRCLAYDAADRYPDAAALAKDLRLQFVNKPLQGVRNRSLRERWAKWRRRQPYGLVLAFMAAVLVGTLAGGGAFAWRHFDGRREEALKEQREGRDLMEKARYPGAVDRFRRGLKAVEGLPWCGGLCADLRRDLASAEGQQAARDLHALVDRVCFLYPFDDRPAAGLRGLESECRTLWVSRLTLQQQLAPAGGETGEQVRHDLLDFAVLWTDLRVRLGPDADEARRDGLRVLDEAEAAFGASPVLAHERRHLTRALGQPAPADGDGPPARTAWEHYALGRAYLREGDDERASQELLRALDLDADGFWPNYAYGQCAYRTRRYDEAALAFSVCVGLAPRTAGVDPATIHYNLAVVHLARDDRAGALKAVRQALRHQPDHPQALALRDRLEADR